MKSKYEKFEIQKVKRSEIHGSDYNPRTITASALKKLRNKIRKDGLIVPITINKRTGNIVGGHQRLNVMDDLHRGKEYELTVAVIDVDAKKEAELNIFLNNPSAQGDWDKSLLIDFKTTFEDLDFIVDCGFDKFDLDYMFGDTEYGGLFKENKTKKKVLSDIDKVKQSDKMRKLKKKFKEKQLNKNDSGTSEYSEYDDYYMVIVFPTNQEKHNFLRKLGIKQTERFIKASKFLDNLTKSI